MTSAHTTPNTLHSFLIALAVISSVTHVSIEGIPPACQTSSQDWVVELGCYRDRAEADLLTGSKSCERVLRRSEIGLELQGLLVMLDCFRRSSQLLEGKPKVELCL